MRGPTRGPTIRRSLLISGALALLAVVSAPPISAQRAADRAMRLYVAKNGKDTWSGKLPTPNRAKTDGPLASVHRAQQVVRELRRSQSAPRPIEVLVRKGAYFLPEPLTFTPEDSGTPEAPVTYAAYPKERPVLSAGRALTGWKVDGQGRWQVTLPEAARGEWSFTQLFVNGQRRYRPRLPKKGYYFIADTIEPEPGEQGYSRFRYAGRDIRADWHNLGDVEALCFQIWTMARLRIQSVDEAARTVTFTGTTRGTAHYSALPRGNRYLLENVREALTEPGEWYLDGKTGVLTYLPRRGETPKKTQVIAPRLEHLVRLQGDVPGRKWVQHLRFVGLTFAHTNWVTPPQGNAYPQAEVNLSAAVGGEGVRDCVFERCAITHTGAYALELGAGSKRNVVRACELTDLGAGGVKIGTTNRAEDEEAVASHTLVEDCLIAHGGRMHPAAVGVWIGHSPYNRILHNEIRDFYYTGISVGWSWGYGPSNAHHNILAYNHISQIGQGVLSDMGGIYLLGLAPGTHLHHNLIHDVNAFGYGGWGIYPDEGSTSLLIENNLVHRTKSAGFHQHYGRENVVRNNIFAFGREAQVMRTRAEDHLSFTFERNIVYWKEGPLLGSNWSGDNYKLDRNLYWQAEGKPFDLAGMTLEQWRAKGQDVHSRVADPLFVDPAKGEFRLKPGSPALSLGFKPIDLKGVGRRVDGVPGRTAAPPRAFPPPPPPPPPAPIVDDFEATSAGRKPMNAMIFEENEQAVIRVTDEAAASGKQSLKFTDGPGQQNTWNPHLYYSPGYLSGTAECRFALRVEPGAHLFHEWRDNANPYHVGPSLWIGTDGTLRANQRELLKLPHGQWVTFHITCRLGQQAKGRYDLTVQLPGEPARSFRGLACDPEFRQLHWFGFTANADGPGVFYLDDLELKPEG